MCYGTATDKFKPVLEDRGQNGRDQGALECVHETTETSLIAKKYEKSHPNIQQVLLSPPVTKTAKSVFSSLLPLALFSPFYATQPGTPSSQRKYPTYPRYLGGHQLPKEIQFYCLYSES